MPHVTFNEGALGGGECLPRYRRDGDLIDWCARHRSRQGLNLSEKGGGQQANTREVYQNDFEQ